MSDIYQLKRAVQDLAGTVERINEALRFSSSLRDEHTISAEDYDLNCEDLKDLRQALLELKS